MKALEIAQKRYTAKHYLADKKIPQKDLDELLEILRLAPSSVNSQPWHFIVAHSKEAKEKIASAAHFYNKERILEASDVVVFCSKKSLPSSYLDRLVQKETQDGRLVEQEIRDKKATELQKATKRYEESAEGLDAWIADQVHIALGFFLFAAASMGIDATTIGGLERDELDKVLSLENKGLHGLLVVSLGYHDPEKDHNATRPKSRLTKEEVISYL